MTSEDIRKLMRAEPFQPFRIHTLGGKRLDVPHPDFIYIPPKNPRTVYVSDAEGHVDIINVTVIARVTYLDDPRESSNGTEDVGAA
ncbi:MAG: hypothetical protein AAFR38_03385 [Planctomycetota bacterium]